MPAFFVSTSRNYICFLNYNTFAAKLNSMKKLLLVMMLACFSLGQAQAKFGINGGFSSAVISTDFDDLSAGYYAGVFAEIGIPKFATLQPALNYVRINKDSYTQVPVMFKFYVLPKFNLQLGPQFAFRMGEKTGGVSRTNFGAAFGLGADLFSGLLIEARYAVQLNDAFDSAPAAKDIRYNIFNIGLGLRL